MRRVRAGVLDPRRAALAAVVLLVAVAAAWSAWQPLRSVHAGHDALAALDAAPRDPTAVDRARKLAQQAEDRNPLSVEPLFDRAVVETVAGRKDAARVALEDAVRLQPSNPATWLRLADFALHQEANPARALGYLGPALYLDPRSQDGAALYLEATRSGAAPGAPGAAATTTAPPATAPATTTPTTIPTTPATPTTPGTTTTIGPSTGATP
jgi:cytochrome c-type biogenesis protein CcmH/NrfG